MIMHQIDCFTTLTENKENLLKELKKMSKISNDKINIKEKEYTDCRLMFKEIISFLKREGGDVIPQDSPLEKKFGFQHSNLDRYEILAENLPKDGLIKKCFQHTKVNHVWQKY